MLFNSISFSLFLPIVFYTFLVCHKKKSLTEKYPTSRLKLLLFMPDGTGGLRFLIFST